MTNAQIIGAEQMRLLELGKIRSTGRMLRMVDENGKEIRVPEPEAIHTYQVWKQMGYQVQKGQKAVTTIVIWKYVPGRHEDDDSEEDAERARMFMKKSAFFSASQVEQVA